MEVAPFAWQGIAFMVVFTLFFYWLNVRLMKAQGGVTKQMNFVSKLPVINVFVFFVLVFFPVNSPV